MTMNRPSYKDSSIFYLSFLLLMMMPGCRPKQTDDDAGQQQVKAVVTVKADKVAEHDADTLGIGSRENGCVSERKNIFSDCWKDYCDEGV